MTSYHICRIPNGESFFEKANDLECNGLGQVPETCVCNKLEQQIECGVPADEYLAQLGEILSDIDPNVPPGVTSCLNYTPGGRKKRSIVCIYDFFPLKNIIATH